MLGAEKGRAWIELDMDNLRHNVQVLRAAMPEGCQLMPVLKANAYGHGAEKIAAELSAMKVKAFAVACAVEGAELRQAGVTGEILVLGYTQPSEFPLLKEYGLTQTVVDAEYAGKLAAFGRSIPVHVAVDTGMHRLGIAWDDERGLSRAFKKLHVRGMFTHLCTDDTECTADVRFTHLQLERFRAATQTINNLGYKLPKLHVQSSYGLVNYPEIHCDYVRAGIALYGLLSTGADTDACTLDLRPVAAVKARITSVRELSSGEGAGYGLKYKAERTTKIASLSIGYADGLPRSLSCGNGGVLINGFYAPVVGQICMDQTMVDVTGISGVGQGGEAVVIGRNGELELTACDLAARSGTIANEILSRLGERLQRTAICAKAQSAESSERQTA